MRRMLLGGSVAAAVVLPLIVALVAAWANGATLANVRTTSMAPGIPAGSLVVLGPVDPSTVGPGTVIGFRDERLGVVTHRVIEVLDRPGGRFFVTQGDGNRRPDGRPVPARDVVGTVRWRIGGLGAFIAGLTDGRVRVAAVAVPLALLAASELAGRRRSAASTADVQALEAENARLRAIVGLRPRPVSCASMADRPGPTRPAHPSARPPG